MGTAIDHIGRALRSQRVFISAYTCEALMQEKGSEVNEKKEDAGMTIRIYSLDLELRLQV